MPELFLRFRIKCIEQNINTSSGVIKALKLWMTTTKREVVKRDKQTVTGRRAVLTLPPDLYKALKIRCVEEDCSVSDAVARAIETWVKR